ncbi:MAG: hypothetical protein SFX19_04765 [Alphaproteobacteria bacterium]|nr:hypothetical protein [Alphaproteobacteria bacterium]
MVDRPLTDIEQQLFSAVTLGNTDAVRKLTTPQPGWMNTLLPFTTPVAEIAIESLLPKDEKCGLGNNRTYLMDAMWTEQGEKMVKTMLASLKDQTPKGIADFLNATDDDGNTALHYAKRTKNLDGVLSLMVAAKIKGVTLNLDVRNNANETALSRAVRSDNIEMAKLLLNNGASADGVYGGTESPLVQIASSNNEMLAMLAKHNPNLVASRVVNTKGEKLLNGLEYAAYNGKAEAITTMRDNMPAEKYLEILKSTDAYGKNPLHYAVESLDCDAAEVISALTDKLIPERKAELIFAKNNSGDTPVDMLLNSNDVFKEEVLAALLKDVPRESIIAFLEGKGTDSPVRSNTIAEELKDIFLAQFTEEEKNNLRAGRPANTPAPSAAPPATTTPAPPTATPGATPPSTTAQPTAPAAPTPPTTTAPTNTPAPAATAPEAAGSTAAEPAEAATIDTSKNDKAGKMLAAMDKGGDSRVSDLEFKKGTAKYALGRLMRAMDTDGNGEITSEEMTGALTAAAGMGLKVQGSIAAELENFKRTMQKAGVVLSANDSVVLPEAGGAGLHAGLKRGGAAKTQNSV